MAPPPPPPTALQLKAGGLALSKQTQKKVPKPGAPLKTLNWTPVPPHKIQATVWEKIEDEKMYKHINLQELASCFAAGARVLEMMVKAPCNTDNCTIMLSKLKLSHREIRHTVMSMDEKSRLPKDMIEQMLKFVPTKDELLLLREAVVRHKSPAVLALADRFLYEVGQVPRYEKRLRCLHTIRTFSERLDEMKPYLNAVIQASTTLGNAQGFTISSLNLIHGVKSALRTDRNLMHFIVELVEKKFPDLLKLKRELSTVYEAARFNRPEMEAEMRLIEASLREIASELAAQQKQVETVVASTSNASDSVEGTQSSTKSSVPEEPGTESVSQKTDPGLTRAKEITKSTRTPQPDRFIPVVNAFLESARSSFREVQALNRNMEEKFSACAKFYAEEDSSCKKCSPDDFFGAFSKCFNQFTECYQMVWEEREELERTKRQTLVRSIFSKKNDKKRNLNNATSGKDFESLVSALQSGEIFSDDLSRLRSSIRIPQRRTKNGVPTAICASNNTTALKAA
uniref:FH2 domain-containing protein n=1 Tax=Ditylenchus dipsaci TaxID=166011 RepID=A0A915D5Q3_9BILA